MFIKETRATTYQESYINIGKKSIIMSKFISLLSCEKSLKILRLLKVENVMRFQLQPPLFRSTFPHQSSGGVGLSQHYAINTKTRQSSPVDNRHSTD